ncbi:type 2 lantipeptide synthetase LanM family protein [Nostoc sp. CHAB 5824]|nr:type 2 lantipeptide synthetase LanM family protein [Nostoc sp. CHAB 5824]
MNQQCVRSSAWFHALTLYERMASLCATEYDKSNIETNADLAQRRMQCWRDSYRGTSLTHPPSTTDTDFLQRLAMDGISEEEFLYLLGEPIEAVRDRFPTPPAWLIDLTQAYNCPLFAKSIPLPEILRGEKVTGFLDLIEPLISQSMERLRQGVQVLLATQSNLAFDPNTVEEVLFTNLPERLLGRLSSTLVLELHVARLQGLLEGDTSERRFESFLQRLRQRHTALTILQEYPVLARQIVSCLDNWVTFSLEFLDHLCADWNAIRATFSPYKDPGILVQLNSGMGDRHRGGRSVLLAMFSSGLQIVYKPRSLAVDVHFQQLLTWLNERGAQPPFQTINILNCGSYGWIEYISAQTCTSQAEIQRFYERQGGYLALLYALDATDFHCDNLIASGEHPILIDLETLFHPRFEKENQNQSDWLASHTMANSVLRIGLLPQREGVTEKFEGVDISGLGASEGQISSKDIPYWDGIGTDEMQLKRKRMEISVGRHRPTLNGAEVNVLDYTEAIEIGFTNTYQLLLQHRDELLSDDGSLAHFATDQVRVVLRETKTYSELLRNSFHPDLLRNALDRDRFFDRLWISAKYNPHLIKVIPAECADLERGDIPLFTTQPSSRDLWNSNHERIPCLYRQSSMERVRSHVQQLSEADLEKQLWFIRASLTSLAMEKEQIRWSTYTLTEPQIAAECRGLLAAAISVGDRLEMLALRGQDDATWLGLTFTNKRHWSLLPLGPDLYDGIPGIVLFLAYLGAITQEQRYTDLAQLALATLRRWIEQRKSHIRWIGAFNGWGGIIYTLVHLSTLWKQPELLAEAEALVALLPNLLGQDEELDIISGSAGCIGSLINLYCSQPSSQTLDAAIQCGDRLISKAKPGWLLKKGGTKPLTGFSHGASGMAWALLELAALTGEERFRTAALNAIAYERSLFCPEVGNWPDLRNFADTVLADSSNQHIFMTAWCHGAPGVGLARLRCLPYIDDAEIRSEIHIALTTTLNNGFGGNHSLCHGDLGNLELLLQASLILDEPQWKTQLDRLSTIILESIDKFGWLCGVPLGVETPGLMTGLSGIGYQMLRLAAPSKVPSVLMLEYPKQHNESISLSRTFLIG